MHHRRCPDDDGGEYEYGRRRADSDLPRLRRRCRRRRRRRLLHRAPKTSTAFHKGTMADAAERGRHCSGYPAIAFD